MKIKRYKKSLMLLVIIAAAALALALIPTHSLARDGDGDGYDTKVEPVDCNDKDPNINPGAQEVCNDGIDNDCDDLIDANDLDCGGGAADSDGDGFLDDTEKAGITLPSGLTLTDGATHLPPCDGIIPREKCVKWDSPDVFMIIERANPSNLASPPYDPTNPDPLAILHTFTNSAGVSVVPHELIETGKTDRLIADGQHAIRVTEHLDTNLGPLGFAPTGVTPNTPISGAGEVDVYTERIKNEVNRLCTKIYTFCDRKGICTDASPDVCQNEDGSVSGVAPLCDLYEQNVLAHEGWHAISLAPSESAEVTLHHYNPDTGWLMEQSIGSSAKMDRDGAVTVILYISEEFHADSKALYQLK